MFLLQNHCSMNPQPIPSLPVEILQVIFNFLVYGIVTIGDHPLRSVRLTCRTWRELAMHPKFLLAAPLPENFKVPLPHYALRHLQLPQSDPILNPFIGYSELQLWGPRSNLRTWHFPQWRIVNGEIVLPLLSPNGPGPVITSGQHTLCKYFDNSCNYCQNSNIGQTTFMPRQSHVFIKRPMKTRTLFDFYSFQLIDRNISIAPTNEEQPPWTN